MMIEMIWQMRWGSKLKPKSFLNSDLQISFWQNKKKQNVATALTSIKKEDLQDQWSAYFFHGVLGVSFKTKQNNAD